MAIIVPNVASMIGTSGSVVGSADKWIWIGFTTPIGTSGCVMFYRTASAVSGSEMMIIAASQATIPNMQGPFNSPCGVYVATGSGGSAVVWMKQ